MKKLLIFSVFLVISLIILVSVKKGKVRDDAGLVTPAQNQSEALPETIEEDTYQVQTKSFGKVEVEVRPKQLEAGQESVFNILLNTHSVELDYDYTQISTLIDGQSNNYQAISWDGGESGHHLNGKLSFEVLKNGANSVTLTLSGIDNQTHSFTWDVLQ